MTTSAMSSVLLRDGHNHNTWDLDLFFSSLVASLLATLAATQRGRFIVERYFTVTAIGRRDALIYYSLLFTSNAGN